MVALRVPWSRGSQPIRLHGVASVWASQSRRRLLLLQRRPSSLPPSVSLLVSQLAVPPRSRRSHLRQLLAVLSG